MPQQKVFKGQKYTGASKSVSTEKALSSINSQSPKRINNNPWNQNELSVISFSYTIKKNRSLHSAASWAFYQDQNNHYSVKLPWQTPSKSLHHVHSLSEPTWIKLNTAQEWTSRKVKTQVTSWFIAINRIQKCGPYTNLKVKLVYDIQHANRKFFHYKSPCNFYILN